MITINNLDFGYRKNKKLFSELNLELETGRIYGLLGKNGSGKTTLMKQIAGLLYAQNGEIILNGENPKKRSPKFLSSYFMVPEEFETPPVTVKNFLKITAPFYPFFNEGDFYKYLSEFNLDVDGKLSNLSFGQKKKVMLSFGLATHTPVVLSDEPTNGLDIPSKSTFRKIMASAINEDRLFVISTHQVRDIEGIIDAIVVLDNGKIIFNQDLETVSDKLSFKTLKSLDEDDVLYAEKHLNTYEAIVRKKDEEHSHINMELLFNSIIEKDSKVVNEF
ncbi:MAG: ABC transporter ATP-binding protein [Chlorobi bacterium]|nr:ABC transporter ATP-binding protein [Chlorobiota bacterium]